MAIHIPEGDFEDFPPYMSHKQGTAYNNESSSNLLSASVYKPELRDIYVLANGLHIA